MDVLGRGGAGSGWMGGMGVMGVVVGLVIELLTSGPICCRGMVVGVGAGFDAGVLLFGLGSGVMIEFGDGLPGESAWSWLATTVVSSSTNDLDPFILSC